MKARTVTLNRGPFAGRFSFATHQTAFLGGEIYVWDGSADPDQFVHAQSALMDLPAEQRERELGLVILWLQSLGGALIYGDITPHVPDYMETAIPIWRINAWYQLYKRQGENLLATFNQPSASK